MTSSFTLIASATSLILGARDEGITRVLHDIPCRDVRCHALSKDGRRLAILDLAGKRFQHFAVGADGVRRTAVITLSKGQRGDSVVLWGDTAFIGGGSMTGSEALWMWTGERLEAVPLPEGLGRPGKAFDHLYIDGGRLVAVDDVVRPKYVVTYELRAEGPPTPLEVLHLPSHGPNARILGGATGERKVALFSSSVGRSGVHAHIAILDKRSAREVAHCEVRLFERASSWVDTALPSRGSARHGLDPATLDGCPAMVFLGDLLLLATSAGVFVANLGSIHSREPRFAQVPGTAPFDVLDLASIDGEGVVVALRDTVEARPEWLSLDALRAAAGPDGQGE